MTAAYLPLVLRDGPAVVAYDLVPKTRDTLRWWTVMMPARGYSKLDDDERDYIQARIEVDFRERRAEWCDRKVARLVRLAS